MARVFIGVGSNIDPAANVLRALRLLRDDIDVIAISTFYRTAPVDRPEQERFYNGVLEARTELSPGALKPALRRVETALGRVRSADKYAARVIDLDVLVYDDLVLEEPEILRRAFLARPLCELCPGLVIPGAGRGICEAAEGLGPGGLEPLAAYTDMLRREILQP